MKKRFVVLKVLASVLKVLGIVVAAFSVLGGLGALIVSVAGGDLWSSIGFDTNSGFLVGLAGSFGIIIFGVFYAVILYGYGELLMLFLAMEENTFKTVKLLEDVIKDDKK